jgi:hypothetical protein
MEFDKDFVQYMTRETGHTPKEWIRKALSDSLEILQDSFKRTADDTIEYAILMKRIYTIHPFLERSGKNLLILPLDEKWVKSELESYVDFLIEEAIPDAEKYFMKFILKGEVYILKAILVSWPRRDDNI